MHNFRELKIWKMSIELAEQVYQLTSQFPEEEKYGLKNQMNRSSISIASNIAEGSGRTTNKEFSRFIDISLGSSYELETQMILARKLFHVEINAVTEKLNELQKMIGGFKKTLAN